MLIKPKLFGVYIFLSSNSSLSFLRDTMCVTKPIILIVAGVGLAVAVYIIWTRYYKKDGMNFNLWSDPQLRYLADYDRQDLYQNRKFYTENVDNDTPLPWPVTNTYTTASTKIERAASKINRDIMGKLYRP